MDLPISPLFLLTGISLILIIAGLIEFHTHQLVLQKVPVRIHVNGTRGKSSVTRLIAAGLRAGGIRVFAKTTGTAPRVIDAAGVDRVIHRLRKASIGEQVRLMRFFAREKAEVVVIECMAVQPQYQWISEHQMIKAKIGVITNVRPDHLDEMGPTMKDITLSLGNTIPVNGAVVTADESAYPVLADIAASRQSSIKLIDENAISREDLLRFSYIEHPQNIALALDVCEKMGVDQRTALDGMVTVQPDLGALIVWNLDFSGKSVLFINGMAANDPVSTLQIWNFIIDRYPVEGEICIFLNTREDRKTRTRQMLQLVMENIKPNRLVVRGKNIKSILQHLKHYSPETEMAVVPMDAPVGETIEHLQKCSRDSLIFAIGNQVGKGQEILIAMKGYRTHG
ncbi:MAG: poly-gamma-glutamate synthase PgsB [Fidelibacterota bacterium]